MYKTKLIELMNLNINYIAFDILIGCNCIDAMR